MTPYFLTFFVCTVAPAAVRRPAALELAEPIQPVATIATAAVTAATTPIRTEVFRVAIAVTLDKGGAGAQDRSLWSRAACCHGRSCRRVDRRAAEHREAVDEDSARVQGLLRPSHRHIPHHRRLLEIPGEGAAHQLLRRAEGAQ